MKYYVVREGRQKGIFETRDITKKHIDGFPGARYKAFPSFESAQLAFERGYGGSKGQLDKSYLKKVMGSDFEKSISTDAACPNNPGPIEYRGVLVSTGEEIFKIGPLQYGSTNIAEYLAIVHGLARIIENKKSPTILYTDSKIALSWVKKKRLNTSITRNPDNQEVRELLDRAKTWLEKNPERERLVELKKRPTKEWGEIPADFGRK